MALETFGTNGWLAPGSNSYLTGANSERGMGWNPVTKNLVIPNRNGVSNNVAIIDGRTGAVNKTLDTTGVAGGTLPMQQAGVSDDGSIFVTNLQSGSSSGSPFKIYKWNSESDTNAPSVAFSQVNPAVTSGAYRFGDAFDVYGSGNNMVFAAAGSATGTSNNLANNSNFMIGRLDGSNTNTIYRAIPDTLTASNDYRLSLAFVDADTIIGNQGTSAKLTDFSVTSDSITSTGATIVGTFALGAAERGLDYTVINGTAVLATINTITSQMNVYDVTDLNNIRLLDALTTTTGTLTFNANVTSSVKWGEMLSPTSQILYGMSTNQGIQAMVFNLVPEPTSLMLGALGMLGLMVRRRR